VWRPHPQPWRRRRPLRLALRLACDQVVVLPRVQRPFSCALTSPVDHSADPTQVRSGAESELQRASCRERAAEQSNLTQRQGARKARITNNESWSAPPFCLLHARSGLSGIQVLIQARVNVVLYEYPSCTSRIATLMEIAPR